MKRRNFIFNSIGGLAGLIILSASDALMNNAMALPSASNGKDKKESDPGKLESETVVKDFKHQGHDVKILKRTYKKTSGEKVNQWVMKFDDRELPQGYFSRLGDEGCYSSELLPFEDICDDSQTLAEALVDGHVLNLYDLNPTGF